MCLSVYVLCVSIFAKTPLLIINNYPKLIKFYVGIALQKIMSNTEIYINWIIANFLVIYFGFGIFKIIKYSLQSASLICWNISFKRFNLVKILQ